MISNAFLDTSTSQSLGPFMLSNIIKNTLALPRHYQCARPNEPWNPIWRHPERKHCIGGGTQKASPHHPQPNCKGVRQDALALPRPSNTQNICAELGPSCQRPQLIQGPQPQLKHQGISRSFLRSPQQSSGQAWRPMAQQGFGQAWPGCLVALPPTTLLK